MNSQTSLVSYPPEYWPGFLVRLIRFYEGAPIGPEGTFSAPLFVVWHLLEGSVTVRNENYTTRAGPGDWVVCLPGRHYQRFSKNARLLSMHFGISCSGAILSWRGQEAVRLPPGAFLSALAGNLRSEIANCSLPEHYVVGERGPCLPLPLQLRLQSAALSFLYPLLDRLAQNCGVWVEAWKGSDARTRLSLEWFAGRSWAEPFSRDALAERCGLSTSQLDRIWRRELGITPRQYWERQRVNHACELLRDGHLSIKQVAGALGFERPSHFTIWFRQACQVSPRNYRQFPTIS